MVDIDVSKSDQFLEIWNAADRELKYRLITSEDFILDKEANKVGFKNVVGQDNINRFDKKNKKTRNKNKRRNYKKQNNEK